MKTDKRTGRWVIAVTGLNFKGKAKTGLFIIPGNAANGTKALSEAIGLYAEVAPNHAYATHSNFFDAEDA